MDSDLFNLTQATGPAGPVNVVELTLPQSLDSGEFDRLNDALLTLFNGRTSQRWVLDLAGVKYMGSAVLGLIVNVRQQVVKDDGKLVLCNPTARLSEVFYATSLQRLFTLCKSREEAILAAGSR